MKAFKGTKGPWKVIANSYTKSPKRIVTGVGVEEKVKGGIYTTFVCNSILPDNDADYIKQERQIEADMQLIASSPEMLDALIKITQSKSLLNAIYIATKVIDKAII